MFHTCMCACMCTFMFVCLLVHSCVYHCDLHLPLSSAVFVGELQRSKVTHGLYTHYFKVSEFIKHNSLYNSHNRWLTITPELTSTPQCPAHNDSIIKTYNPTTDTQDNTISITNTLSSSSVSTAQTQRIPQYGMVKVYSKCPLTIGVSHLISASLSTVVISGARRDRLVMCCGEEDLRHAANQLREMLLRQQCCRLSQ